jgi:hypothetical protein
LVVLINTFILPIQVQKGKNYMFLHTYTFATNQIPLVLKELSLYRNLHQIQVESIKKAPLGKAQLSKKGKKPNQRTNLGQPTLAPRHRPREQPIAQSGG